MRGWRIGEASNPGPPHFPRGGVVLVDPAAEPAVEDVVHVPHTNIPNRAWRDFQNFDLEAEMRRPVRTVREPPRWFRGQLRRAFGIALNEWRRTRSAAAWKVFLLVPRMLLEPTEEDGQAGKDIFAERMRRFLRGEWADLLVDCGNHDLKRNIEN